MDILSALCHGIGFVGTGGMIIASSASPTSITNPNLVGHAHISRVPKKVQRLNSEFRPFQYNGEERRAEEVEVLSVAFGLKESRFHPANLSFSVTVR